MKTPKSDSFCDTLDLAMDIIMACLTQWEIPDFAIKDLEFSLDNWWWHYYYYYLISKKRQLVVALF